MILTETGDYAYRRSDGIYYSSNWSFKGVIFPDLRCS